MKRSLTFITLAALVLTTGCGKDVLVEKKTSSQFELSVVPVQAQKVTGTRGYVEGSSFEETTYESLHATTKTTIDRTMQISAYLYPQNGDPQNFFVGKTYANSGDGINWWNVEKGQHIPIYWPVGGKLDFLAYSVSENDSKSLTAVWNNENAANDITLKVPAENSQNDILFASAYGIESTSSAQPIDLKFNHAQAWIEFVLTGSVDSINTDGIVTFKRIELEKIYNAGTLTFFNNGGNAAAKWNFVGEQRQDICVDNCYEVEKLNRRPQYLDMLIPEQAKTSFTLYYTLGSDKTEHSYFFSTDKKTWLMGEKYVYKINITTSEITVEPSVTTWDGPTKDFNHIASIYPNEETKGTVEVSCLGGEKIADNLYEFGWNGQAYLAAKQIDKTWGFKQWSDGCTEAERVITVNEDTVFVAEFAASIISAKSNYPVRTTEEPAVECLTYYNKAKLTAAPAETGWKFFRWTLNGAEISREMTINTEVEDTTEYVAEYIPAATINAVFSITDSTQVVFANGNLKWDGSEFSTDSTQTAYPAVWSEEYVGHFYWTNDESLATELQYIDSLGTADDILFTNDPSGASLPNDSFTCNGLTGVFRSLYGSEWSYLLSDGAYANEKRAGLYRYGVTVEGVANCGVIYPDAWDGELVENNGTMESIPDGVVVLPPAGYHLYSEGSPYGLTSAGSIGYYWVGNPFNSTNGYYLYFNGEGGHAGAFGRHAGCSIRLAVNL